MAVKIADYSADYRDLKHAIDGAVRGTSTDFRNLKVADDPDVIAEVNGTVCAIHKLNKNGYAMIFVSLTDGTIIQSSTKLKSDTSTETQPDSAALTD